MFVNWNDWKIIFYFNIIGEYLNLSGVYLILFGIKVFFFDFVNYVKNIWIFNELFCFLRELFYMINEVIKDVLLYFINNFLFIKCGFKMVFFNIISLIKYIDEFRILFVNYFLDVIFINEMRFE